MQAARGTPLTGPAAAGDQPDSRAGAEQPRRVAILVGVALAVLALDVASKAIVVATLSQRSCLNGRLPASQAPLRLAGSFLELCVSRNPGAAFSFGTGMTVIFSAIAVGVIIVILRTSRQIRSLPWALTLGLLLGGATGNLTDRIFRYPAPFRGYVVDWIQLPHWPVFNLADSAIVCGGVLAVLLSARGIRLDGARQGPEPADGSKTGPGAADPPGPGPDPADEPEPGGAAGSGSG